MFLCRYQIAQSAITGAGKGVFLDQSVSAGDIVVAPDAIDRTYSWDELNTQPDRQQALAASVRWFENRFTISRDWPDECYINHSFTPNGLWHLGFVFAHRDLHAGDELTIDYRHLLQHGEAESFNDAQTGQPIIGYSWQQSLQLTTVALAELIRSRG